MLRARNVNKATVRAGFTLVELMVVIALLMVVAGLVILFLPRVQESHRAAQGGSTLQTTLLIAKQRALRDQSPRGVRLMVDLSTGYVTELQNIEQPEDFSGGTLATFGPSAPYTAVTISGVDLWNGDTGGDRSVWHVLEGDYLEILGSGQVYRIKAVASNGLLLYGPADNPPGRGIPNAITQATSNYRIIRAPRPTGEDVIQMPAHVAIDLNTNWRPPPSPGPPPTTPPYGYSNLNPLPLPSAGTSSIDILFAPSGRVLSPAVGQDFIALWVRDVSLNTNAATYQRYYDGEPTIIGVWIRSGRIDAQVPDPGGNANPPSAPGDPYTFVRDGRASAQ